MPASANVARGGSYDRWGKVAWADGRFSPFMFTKGGLSGRCGWRGTMVGGTAMHPFALWDGCTWMLLA
jgi:hypothetical protein